MFKTLFMGLLLVFISTASLSQTCNFTLQGTVKDYHDGKPLELAQVYVISLQRTFTTAQDGTFTINGLCAGDFNLIVSHIDCDPKEVSISISADKRITVLLEHHVQELAQVNVIADVHNDKMTTQSTQRIDDKTLRSYSGASLGDALSSVAGVTTLKTGNSVVKPVIHGLFGSRVAIVTNGLRQQDQEWGVEHAPNIDLNAANNIEVVKGASALRYGGDAVGGTIIINPSRVIAKDTISGNLIAQGQTNGRGGSTSATINNYRESGWFQNGTFTYKRLGDFESPDYVLSNTGSETRAVNLRAGFKKFEYGIDLTYSYYDSEIGILRASHIGSVSDLISSINSRQPLRISSFTYDVNAPKQDVTHHSIQLNAFKRFSNLGKLTFNYGFQLNNRLEFDIRRGDNAGNASLDMDLMTQNAALHLLIDRWADTKIELGLDGAYQLNEPNPATGVRRLIPDYTSIKTGGFISAQHNLSEKWLLDGGLRFDYYNIDADKFYLNTRWESLGYDEQYPEYEVNVQGNQILTNPQLDFNLWAFTVGAKHIFNEHYDLSINLNTANRAPNPSELFSDGLHHALATIELGRLDLEEEQSFKVNTVFHLNKAGIDLNINPYINFVNNFIQLEPTGVELTTRGAFPVFQYRQINARLYGVDLNVRYDILKSVSINGSDIANISGNLESDRRLIGLQADFAYIHGTDTETDVALIDMPPAQFQLQATWYNALFNKLDFRAAFQQVWEQTRFPDLDYDVEVVNDQGVREERRVLISQPPSAFSLVNLGLDYTISNTELHLTANNILNTNYRNYLNRQRFYADEVGRDIQLQVIYNF
jgi:iron complex outermembrane receptor protein